MSAPTAGFINQLKYFCLESRNNLIFDWGGGGVNYEEKVIEFT